MQRRGSRLEETPQHARPRTGRAAGYGVGAGLRFLLRRAGQGVSRGRRAVLAGLTLEAADDLRLCLTRDERTEAVEGKAAADSFVERTPFDLVVEVEITNADEGKIARYGDIGVRELWRLHGRKGTALFVDDLRADFFALHPGRPPRRLAASAVLAGLTKPGDVCEAADDLRLCLTRDERTEAVARIVRRRRRASVRAREADAPYAAPRAS